MLFATFVHAMTSIVITHFEKLLHVVKCKIFKPWGNIGHSIRSSWRFGVSHPASDFSCLIVGQVATVAWLDANDTCGSHSIYIPIVLSFPYLSRFLQCLRQYHDTKDKTCLLNGKDLNEPLYPHRCFVRVLFDCSSFWHGNVCFVLSCLVLWSDSDIVSNEVRKYSWHHLL
jgi:hypothetical protein